MQPYNEEPEEQDDPEAWADHLEDEGVMDTLPVNRRKFVALASGFGGASALTSLTGCLGQENTGGGSGGTTKTPEQTQAGKSTPKGEPEVVRIASVPVSASLPLYIAKENFLPQRNIELKLNRAVSGSKVTAQLASGQLEGSAGATGASVMNAINKGIGIKSVCDRTRFIPDRQSTLAFLARKEVYKDGFDLSDAGGLTWATNATSSVGHYHVARALEAHGLSWNDIEFKTLPFPQMVSALSSGAVDITQEVGALVQVAKSKAGAKHVEWTVETSPETQVAHIQLGGPFINQRRNTAVKFIEAYIEATRWMYEQGPFSDKMVKIWKKYTDSSADALLGGVPPWASKNGKVNGDSFVRQQEFWKCMGFQDSIVSKGDLIANDLRKEAVSNIGAAEQEFVPLDTWKEWQKQSPAEFPAKGENNPPSKGKCGGGAVTKSS